MMPTAVRVWRLSWIEPDGQGCEKLVSEQDLDGHVTTLKENGCHDIRWRRL